MLALMLMMMASDARCQVPDACPTDDQLIAAIREREQQHIAEAEAADPTIKASVPPILSIKDVFCAAPFEDSGKVNCKFTVRYPKIVSYRVAGLARKNGGWTIVDMLGANREQE